MGGYRISRLIWFDVPTWGPIPAFIEPNFNLYLTLYTPPRCHAHAIVAGKHPLAASLRFIMSYLKIRIDDPDNGCWLPENTAATPHPKFPAAPPHSRIHRFNYYFWITTRLGDIDETKAFRFNLSRVSKHLHEGTFPKYVMLPKGIGLPE